MRMRQLSPWAALVVVACNGKLLVGHAPQVSEGSGGSDFEPAESVDSGSGGSGYECLSCAGQSSLGGGATLGNAGGSALGSLGQPCIPGSLVTEAGPAFGQGGSPVTAQIRTFSHCSEGLSCNADGNCVPAADCPHDGDLCVVRHAALSANVGGSTESSWGIPETQSSGRKTSIERNGVMALTASESRLYWVEYGTRDALGDYQHDGALLTYAFDDGTTSVIASDLDGPIGIEITSTHAYVYVDGAQPLGAPIRAQLLRVPLAGGSAALVQDGALPWSFVGGRSSNFVAADGRAFWTTQGTETPAKLYSMTSDSDAIPSVFATEGTIAMAIDESDLYYSTQSALMRSPIAQAAPIAIQNPVTQFVLHQDSIYTVLGFNADGGTLQRVPKSGGGGFEAVRGLGTGMAERLRRVGDRYFFESSPQKLPNTGLGERRVLSGSFGNDDPLTQLLQRPNRLSSIDHLWVATASALYWSDGQAIYEQPLLTP